MSARADLVVGFTPLADCAPLVAAQVHGHFARHGLRVELSPEPSWANVRDKLAAGVLDAAHLLAPLPIACTLGVGPVHEPMVTALSLGLNGNAITVSRELRRRLEEHGAAPGEGVAGLARALARLVERERGAGARRLRFASVFPYSMHAYQLRYWLGSAGLRPDRDVTLVVVPPGRVVEALEAGVIDGFCVGEPWSALALARGSGSLLFATRELWNGAPEKVLAVRLEFAERCPEMHLALVGALLEAARWCDAPENRPELARLLSDGGWVPAPVAALEASLCVPEMHVFHRRAASFPWRSHAAWIIAQMLRWGQIEKALDVRAAAASVYRTELARQAAERVGMPCPVGDEKLEEPGAFFDGVGFDAGDVVGHLRRFAIADLRVSLDELAAHQS